MFSSGWQSKRIMHERYKDSHEILQPDTKRLPGRDRADGGVLSITLGLPILQKRIHEHRAPHPLRRDVVARPLAVLEQVLGVLIPARLGVLARRPLPGRARVSRRKNHSKKSSDSKLPRCIRPALLADIDHGKLDEFLAGHALNLTRDGRVRHAQRESPARPSRTVAHNAPSIPGEGRGSARRGPIRSKERHFFVLAKQQQQERDTRKGSCLFLLAGCLLLARIRDKARLKRRETARLVKLNRRRERARLVTG